MKKSEELALFLGMLSGDGCLSIAHNGEGYRHYPIQFWNTDKTIIRQFDDLFLSLFGIRGNIQSRKRPNKREIWEFKKTSRKIYEKIKEIGFPEGVKRDILRVPEMIKKGTKKEKIAFVNGVIITDGSLKDRGILFHSGSKLFLEDLSLLISDLTNTLKPVKEYVQRGKYKSYQLYLNKDERNLILRPRGTMVLRES
jgi:hypothetical protein